MNVNSYFKRVKENRSIGLFNRFYVLHKTLITWARIFIACSCFIARPRTRLSSELSWRIGTSSWSILDSSTTGYWAITPVIPIGPITVNWITQPLNKVNSQLSKIILYTKTKAIWFYERKNRILLGQGLSLHILVSSLSPGHGFPPKAAGGLVQVRVLVCSLPPHVTGQSLQSSQSDQLPSTAKMVLYQSKSTTWKELQTTSKMDKISWEKLLGHGSSLHGLVSSLSPGHSSPPNAAGGLVQVLDRFCTPPPQVTGQSLQSFQSAQLPSTAIRSADQLHQQDGRDAVHQDCIYFGPCVSLAKKE